MRKGSTSEQARSVLETYFSGDVASAKRTLAAQWKEGVQAFENGDYQTAESVFSQGEQAKMKYNLGVIHTKTGAHHLAINAFTRAIEADRFFAVAHFQRAFCRFLNKDYDSAMADYQAALHLLRDNDSIDYSKLGLSGVKLHRTEVLYNIVIGQKKLGHEDAAREMLKSAQKIDATRYSIKTDFISLERQIFVQKDTDLLPISVGYSLFGPPRSAQDVGTSLIASAGDELATNVVSVGSPSSKGDVDPRVNNLRKMIEVLPVEEKDKIYYMLTVLAKYVTHKRDVTLNNSKDDVDISGKEEELARHVILMSKLFFDADIKVMLDRQAKEFERCPDKRVAIWRSWCQLLEQDELDEGNVQNFHHILLNSKALVAATKSVCLKTPTEMEEGYLKQIFHYVFKSSVDSDELLRLATVVSNSCSKNIFLVQPMTKLLLDFKSVKPSEKDHYHIFPSNLHAFQLVNHNSPSLLVLHSATADCKPVHQHLQALCVSSTKNIAKYEGDLSTSQALYSKSFTAVELAIEETVAKLEKLRHEIKDVEGHIATRSAEKIELQAKIADLDSRRSEFINFSNSTELELQTERAANDDRIAKHVASKATIQIFGRKMRLIIFNEKKVCLKKLEALLRTEEQTIANLETKLANYKSSIEILDSEPDILARLESAFVKYKAIYLISMNHSAVMTKALDAYDLIAKKGVPDTQPTAVGRKSFLKRKSSILNVYELMASERDDVITARSEHQQLDDDVIARELKKRVLHLVAKQKYLAANYNNLAD